VDLFEDLASELSLAWMQRGRDESVFPELAERMLERFVPASSVAPDDLFRWSLEASVLPRQFDLRSSFGNFALTVATRDDFHIDVLVWTDSTTAIHQHNFSGAFHVLQGSSLHTRWTFEETGRWSDRLKRGRLAVHDTEWLQTGSTRPILPGDQLIHSLFHLDAPSITVVVRTPTSARSSPQMNYERSGLAYDPHFEIARVEKIRQLLCLLWTTDHPQRMALSEAALRGIDAHSTVRIISSMRLQTPLGTPARLIDMVAARDAELAALLRKTMDLHERTRVLVDLRRQTRSARHRMLLALVLNLPDRTAIDAVLRQIAPGEIAADWLWDTLRSMRESPRREDGGNNILGLSLDQLSEQILEMLLRGRSVTEVTRAMTDDPELVEDLRVVCSAFSASPLLGPLLNSVDFHPG
jgi:hypothetical protein